MTTNAVTPPTPNPQAAATTPKNPLGSLGKDDFLRLLVTQLKYQDPMSPSDNQQFMAQMAQFAMVEGINNLESTLGSLQGVGLIGKQITYTADDGSTKNGIASSIAMSGSSYTVTVGSDEVDPTKILQVTTAGAAGTDPAPTGGDNG
jgi:flagellar basal-body rod modification protein FlgD